MLKEFAFTPHVFSPPTGAVTEQWRRCVRTIAIRLFTSSIVPIVVAGLHSGSDGSSWEREVVDRINRIQDHSLRAEVQSLFRKLADSVVYRPACTCWPGDDESGWCEEVAETNALEPIHQVIVQDDLHVSGHPRVFSCRDADSFEFWQVLQERLPNPQSLTDVVRPIRTILFHSTHLIISAPYAGTTAFAFECIRQALSRPAGFPSPSIEVHQALARDANPETRIAWIRSQLPRDRGIRWYFWPDNDSYRERLVLGGWLASLGANEVRFVGRFGVSFTHVWGEGDPADAEPSTCALLSRHDVHAHARAIQQRSERLALAPMWC